MKAELAQKVAELKEKGKLDREVIDWAPRPANKITTGGAVETRHWHDSDTSYMFAEVLRYDAEHLYLILWVHDFKTGIVRNKFFGKAKTAREAYKIADRERRLSKYEPELVAPALGKLAKENLNLELRIHSLESAFKVSVALIEIMREENLRNYGQRRVNVRRAWRARRELRQARATIDNWAAAQSSKREGEDKQASKSEDELPPTYRGMSDAELKKILAERDRTVSRLKSHEQQRKDTIARQDARIAELENLLATAQS